MAEAQTAAVKGLSCELQALTTETGQTQLLARLRNTGEDPVSFLPWGSVFSSPDDEVVFIASEGDPVLYQGPSAKRREPQQTDFVTIAAGGVFENLYPLSQVYALKKGVEYRLEVLPGSLPVLEAADLHIDVLQLDCNKLEFTPAQDAILDPLIVAANQTLQTPRLCIRPPYGGDCRPIVDACGARETEVRGLHDKAKGWGRVALADFRNDAGYSRWFGTYDVTRFKKAQSVVRDVRFQMARRTVRYYCMSLCSDPSVYAFVLKGVEDVYFCPLFWTAPDADGYDTKVGTILHEITHIYSDTEDHKYGVRDALGLAASRPWLAIENADNFQYYFEEKF